MSNNFRFIRENWLKRDFFALLSDQPASIEGIFKLFYPKSKFLPWFYIHGEAETLCGTDLVRIMGTHAVEGVCRQKLYLPDNTSMEVLVFSWYTRRGMFRGIVVDPKDKQSVAYALDHMKSRSGCL